MKDLISAGLLHNVIMAAVPLLIAAHGELIIELSGILNLAIAGMVALGASAAFVTTFSLGGDIPAMVAGFGAGALAGAGVALLLAYFTVTLKAHQVTVGLGLFMLSLGASELLYRIVIGVSTVSVRVPTLDEIAIPGLAEIPLLGRVFFTHSLVVYLGALLIPVVNYLLFHTSIGLRLRATGENPRCADTLGVRVFGTRYTSAVIGGTLIGIAGAFFPLALLGGFALRTVGGHGWLALMIVIFGKWRPRNITLGALLFAYILALQFSFALTARSVPPQALLALPYVLSIIVLIWVYKHAQAPAALTKPYDREARV